MLLEVEVLIENSVAVQVGLADAFLPTEAVVQLLVDMIDHDIFPVLEFQYSQDVPEIILHVFIVELFNILILIFHFLLLFFVARIFG